MREKWQDRLKMWVIPILSACAVFAFGVWGPSADATTVLHHRLGGLVGESGLVVEGAVMETLSDPGNVDRVPTTTFVLCDLEFVLGAHNSSCLSITVPGGQEADGTTSIHAGMPMLEQNERYLLFLRRQNTYNSPFVGFWQGVFRVVQDGPRKVILSNAGHPVRRVTEDGRIETKREVKLLTTRNSMVEVVQDEPAVELTRAEAAREAMSFIDFVQAIQMEADARLLSGERIPEGLPKSWLCRIARRAEVGDAPPGLDWKEVMP